VYRSFSLFLTLLEYPINNVLAEAKKMRRHLWNKRVPMEQDEMKKIGQELEYKLTSAKLQQTNSELLNEEEIEKVCSICHLYCYIMLVVCTLVAWLAFSMGLVSLILF